MYEKHDLSREICTIYLVILFASPVLATNDGYKNGQNREGTYIIVLGLFFFLVAILIAYLLRKYGCFNAHRDNNSPTLHVVVTGMHADDIESLPSLRYSDIKMHSFRKVDDQLECAVCLAEFEDQEVLRVLPHCLHVYHPQCIASWLVSNASCPVCRASLEHKEGSSVSFNSLLEELSGGLSGRLDLDGQAHVDGDHVTVEI